MEVGEIIKDVEKTVKKMAENILQILKCKKGQSFPMTIAITLVLLMIVLAISEYFRFMIIVQGVKDALQDAVISTVTENYQDIYHGTREGYSGGYRPTATDFQESVNYGDIYNRLEYILGLEYNKGKYEQSTDENILQFTIYSLDVDIKNAEFKSSYNPNDSFEIDSYITLEVPVSFIKSVLPSLKVRIRASGGYTPIF